jgi:TusA-related sulfurtransferase
MKIKPPLLVLLVLVAGNGAWAASAGMADSPILVTFVAAENYTDVKDRYLDTERGRYAVLDELKQHLTKRAVRYLEAGQRLEITITDVDLAGDFEPWHRANLHDVRIVKDIYPPRVTLQFRLLDVDGTVLSEGTRQLQNLGFQASMAWPMSDPLRYDKEMLSTWLRREFKHS